MGACPSVAVTFGHLPVTISLVLLQMAADLDIEFGCSFQCPLAACPLDLFFPFAMKNSWQCWFKSQHFYLFGFLASSYLAFLISLSFYSDTYSLFVKNELSDPQHTPNTHTHTPLPLKYFFFLAALFSFHYVYLIFRVLFYMVGIVPFYWLK